MSKIPANVFRDAVNLFWETKNRQKGAQAQSGDEDRGNRGSVTGGKQMDGFIGKLTEFMVKAGVPRDCIHGKDAILPGYFRATKDWDLVVVQDGKLVAAVELKSQVGSIGNNLNNRVEEALGVAEDIWKAYREKAFGSLRQPWVGYLFLLGEPAHGRKGPSLFSRNPVQVDEPHFEVFDVFREASYLDRYEVFCRRLVLERKYSAACFLTAVEQDAAEPMNYGVPASDLGPEQFIESLLRHVTP